MRKQFSKGDVAVINNAEVLLGAVILVHDRLRV